jgi:hypothetical protein
MEGCLHEHPVVGNPIDATYWQACCRDCGHRFVVRAPNPGEPRMWTNEGSIDGDYSRTEGAPDGE